MADGKGSTSYSYDGTEEHRGLLTAVTDTQAGAFTAAYDPDGALTSQTYPGGLTATTSTDNAGNPTKLDYTKNGNSWATFTNSSDADGRVRAATSPGSAQNHRYDTADRLTQTDDTTPADCTRRSYAFTGTPGLNSDRTALTTTTGIPGTAGDCDLTGATPATGNRSYDTADRLIDTGYTYDTLGRTSTVPAADAASTSSLTAAYYANDLVQQQTQDGRTVSFGLDPASRLRSQTDSVTGKTQTQHYTGGGDSPAWTAVSDGTWTRNVAAPDGNLAAIISADGSVTLQIGNLHGDIVATCTPADTLGYGAYFEATEYGTPRTSNPANPKYGWLGGKQRSTDDLAGLTLMGVRQYNPATGRFLTVDPVPGGSANDYDYANQDPINQMDIGGTSSYRLRYDLGWSKYSARHVFRVFRGMFSTFFPIRGAKRTLYSGEKMTFAPSTCTSPYACLAWAAPVGDSAPDLAISITPAL